MYTNKTAIYKRDYVLIIFTLKENFKKYFKSIRNFLFKIQCGSVDRFNMNKKMSIYIYYSMRQFSRPYSQGHQTQKNT